MNPNILRVLKELQQEQTERLTITQRNSNIPAVKKHKLTDMHRERVIALEFLISAMERTYANQEKV